MTPNPPAVASFGAAAQHTREFPPVPEARIARYTAFRPAGSIRIDGRPDEPDWTAAPWTGSFVDLITGRPTIHETRAALLWDEEFLYAAFRAAEPLVRAKFTENDQPVYRDNDVELFIAGDHAYYEFEINALGTIYDAFFIWQSSYDSAGFSEHPEFDRSRKDVASQAFHGVGFRHHPRGPRFAFIAWDLPGIVSAVAIDGTLNDDSDRDRGWTVEVALPWRELQRLTLGGDRSLPPSDGDLWRINLSRFNQYKEAPPAEDSGGWAWSPHGVWDSHVPECFPYVTFSIREVDDISTSDSDSVEPPDLRRRPGR